MGDIPDIVVWDHPESTMPAGERRTPQESGQRVQAVDGTFFTPMSARSVLKANPEAIRDDLDETAGRVHPRSAGRGVRVVGYKAYVSVTGEVKSPSRQPLTDVPLTLLDVFGGA